MTDYLAAAAGATKVVVFAETPANHTNVDRLNVDQIALIKSVATRNPNIIVVLNTVGPVLPGSWQAYAKSLLEMWFPGSEGGTATARLLLGLAVPGGHTTMTWPKLITDTINSYNQQTPLYPGDTPGIHVDRMSGSTIKATEGIFIGYRYFDKMGIVPNLPFGWGLSYASFRYANLRISPSAGGVNVSFDVTNTSTSVDNAAEVAQVYLGSVPVPAGVQQAVRALRGFARIVLNHGETRTVTIHLGPGADVDGHGDPRAFKYWSTTNQGWATAAGCRRVWVGDADSPAYLPLAGTTTQAGAACTPSTH